MIIKSWIAMCLVAFTACAAAADQIPSVAWNYDGNELLPLEEIAVVKIKGDFGRLLDATCRFKGVH